MCGGERSPQHHLSTLFLQPSLVTSNPQALSCSTLHATHCDPHAVPSGCGLCADVRGACVWTWVRCCLCVPVVHPASGEPEVRRVYEAKAAEYTSRAETLQRFVHARSGPSSVEPPVAAAGGSGVGAPVPPVRRPTSASHSGGASGVEGGCAAPAGASASQLLHAGVQAGVAVAAATAAAATSLNAKYDITGKVSTGIHRLVDTAKDINEKHKVVDKVSTIASAAVVKTQELDAKYGVTATVTGALLGALTRVSEASTEVLRRHEAATSEGAGAHAAPAIAGRK